jgi:lycopene cyclase domain-containing protein
MFKYLFVDLVFIALSFAISLPTKPKHRPRRWLLMLLILCALTAIFDSIIIGLGIVKYNPKLLLGISIGKAPIEDFGYAVGSVVIAPSIWLRLKKQYVPKNS